MRPQRVHRDDHEQLRRYLRDRRRRTLDCVAIIAVMMIALASLMRAAIQHDGRRMLVSTVCFGVVVAVSCYVSRDIL